MIEPAQVRRLLDREGLADWAAVIEDQLDQALKVAAHGDWGRWHAAIGRLPQWPAGDAGMCDGVLDIRPADAPSSSQTAVLREALMVLHPWRKGPYRVAGLTIDTEWRSDWKWDRVLPQLKPLAGRLVLDVGCGNGYHCWRIADEGARCVIGIDPTAVFIAQYLAIARLLSPLAPELARRVQLLPLGIEALPPKLARFDTVLSMGVLYHRRSPLDHLVELRDALRPGGELVLETLVIDGADDRVLVPRGRYAKMRNVWFIPTTRMLENWLERCGFRAVRTVDVTRTTVGEQRSSDWMTFESLADFLDPADNRLTVEGYPAPTRAVLIAEA